MSQAPNVPHPHLDILKSISLPFQTYIADENGDIKPHVIVSSEILAELAVSEYKLEEQNAMNPAQVGHWGRMLAAAERSWEIAERNYRVWRSRFVMNVQSPEGKPDGWKKPSDKLAEAMYRADPQYDVHQKAVEAAKESYNACKGILDAWKEKARAINVAARRKHQDGAM